MNEGLLVTALGAAYADGPRILHEVSLDVAPGEVVAVVGAGASGKTTLARALMGTIPAQGRIVLNNQPIDALTTRARVQAGLHFVPEEGALFDGLSVHENLALGASRLGVAAMRARRNDVLEDLAPLSSRGRQLAGSLSGGERRLLSLGVALMSGARLWILDEPTTGLSPRALAELLPHLGRAAERGVGLLVLEQDPRLATLLAHRVQRLEAGRLC